MSPWGPVSEEEDQNVYLRCTTTDGSPTVLSQTKWFKDGELLKEQPHPILCPTGRVGQDEIELDLCKADPAILAIHPASREDMGHYACSGINIAGEGPISEEIFLDVLCKLDLSFLISMIPHRSTKRWQDLCKRGTNERRSN